MGLFDRFFSKTPTQATFAKAIMDAFRAAGDKRQPTYDAAHSQIVFRQSGKDDFVLNFQNLFAEFTRLDKGERPAWLKRVVSGLGTQMEMPEDFEDVKPDLRPSVRSRSALDSIKIQSEAGGGKTLDVPFIDISEHMLACVVYDLPNSMRFVTQKDLDTWGVSIYEAMEVARQNLDEQKPDQMAVLGDKLYVIATGDAYDGSRIVCLDLVRSLKVDGNPVALPLTRDLLMIAGSDDLEGQKMLIELAIQNTDGRPVCAIPHILDGDEWKPFHPATSPHFDKLRMLELRHFGCEYAEQKELLERRNEALGVDVFVASFSAHSKDGKDASYSVWTKGVLTWLPRTDIVILLDQEKDSKVFAPWSKVESELGDLLEPLDYYPPRWATKGFPTPEQLQTLSTKAS